MGWWPLEGGDDESDTERDGFLSYSAEVHAAGNGFYKGFTRMKPNPTEPDSKKEVHYFRGFYVAGRVAQLVVVAIGGASLL